MPGRSEVLPCWIFWLWLFGLPSGTHTHTPTPTRLSLSVTYIHMCIYIYMYAHTSNEYTYTHPSICLPMYLSVATCLSINLTIYVRIHFCIHPRQPTLGCQGASTVLRTLCTYPLEKNAKQICVTSKGLPMSTNMAPTLDPDTPPKIIPYATT